MRLAPLRTPLTPLGAKLSLLSALSLLAISCSGHSGAGGGTDGAAGKGGSAGTGAAGSASTGAAGTSSGGEPGGTGGTGGQAGAIGGTAGTSSGGGPGGTGGTGGQAGAIGGTAGTSSGGGPGGTGGTGGQAGTADGAAGSSSAGGAGASGQGGTRGGVGGAGAGGVGALDGGAAGADAATAGPVSFTKIRLNPDFYSEGISVGDLDRDGHTDVIAGPYWYRGGELTSKVAFRQPRATPFDVGGDSDCYLIFVYDLNQDGWPDILSFRTAGGAEVVWYENPKGAASTWTEHVVFRNSNSESPTFTDIDGDGQPELVTLSNGAGGWAKPSWASPQAPWTFVAVTARVGWGPYTHGLGVGDVDGDGRRDLILPEGWWAQPAASSAVPWAAHPATFWGRDNPSEGYGGAQMFVDDVDGDGDADIVTSLQAHGWGLAWFENQGGTFVRRDIMRTRAEETQYGVAFAQPHAVELADLDGDGLKDIVTGKRKGSHGSGLTAAELAAPAVLYWFKLVRPAGQSPRYEPHLIDSVAGVGTQVTVADVNGDGRPDILTAARAGAFVFLQR